MLNKFNQSLLHHRSLQVIGHLGTGKSHILTALALTLHLTQRNFGPQKETKRVIYVPTWIETSSREPFSIYLSIFQDAVEYAFIEHSEMIRKFKPEELQTFNHIIPLS